MKKKLTIFLIMAAISLLLIPAAQAGKIVVANDEWTLSNTGFFSPNDPGVFATNVAAWFTGGGAGSFLAYSNNSGLTGSSLAGAMTGAGHTWVVDTTAPEPTLGQMQTYSGIFLGGGLSVDNDNLISYVEGGGNVYLMGGTGDGGAAVEAARWNTFLNHFGLSLAPSYNGIGGSIAISSTHPIFANVDSLYQNNGNSVSDQLPLDDRNVVLVTSGSNGLYAIYDSTAPIPGGILLLGSGMLGLMGLRRYRT